MVEPAMVQLRRIIDKKETSDADKLKAIQLVLDRTGFKPGVEITVGVSKWDELLDDVVDLDRSLPAVGDGGGDPAWEDRHQLAYSAQEEADRERHDEEAREFEAGRIRPNENTILGEVIPSSPDDDLIRPPRHLEE
jgi:hypothetical protein